MSVNYRLLRPEEEDALVDLWLDVFPDTDRDWWKRIDLWDPQRFERIFVAAAPDGTLLSSVRYFPHEVRGLNGIPQQVGLVTNVATRPTARKQGHAGRLIERTIEAIRRNGCAWSMLTADDQSAPVYTRYGYRSMIRRYRQGRITNNRLHHSSTYAVRRYDLFEEPEQWSIMEAIYAVYNAARPLTIIRNPAYWQHIARYIPQWLAQHHALLFVVAPTTTMHEVCGYLLVHVSNEQLAGQAFGLDMVFTAGEIGVRPDHEDALPILINALKNEAAERQCAGRVWFPYQPVINAAVEQLFGTTLNEATDTTLMARPLADDVEQQDLEELFANPHAMCWPLDVD